MTKRQQDRLKRLLPDGKPRYIRCYDDRGVEEGGSIDRFTVVFTGRYAGRRGCDFLAMNAAPFHPQQGFGQRGWSENIIDSHNGSWGGVPIGRKCHLGTRIEWEDLPEDCQKLVLQDYGKMWNLNFRKKPLDI